jgi:cardiolipin synthase
LRSFRDALQPVRVRSTDASRQRMCQRADRASLARSLLAGSKTMTSSYRLADLFTVPGWLSLSRIGFAVWFPVVVHSPRSALAIVAAAGLSDFLDGWYARRFHVSSATGAVLDPITDKVFAASVMVSLVVTGTLPITSALLLSVREIGELPLLLWLALDARARTKRIKQLGSNLLGKLTTALQFAALLAALFGSQSLKWWITATAAMGAFAAWSYWAKFRMALRTPHDRASSDDTSKRGTDTTCW